jgi:hypothetical protein
MDMAENNKIWLIFFTAQKMLDHVCMLPGVSRKKYDVILRLSIDPLI